MGMAVWTMLSSQVQLFLLPVANLSESQMSELNTRIRIADGVSDRQLRARLDFLRFLDAFFFL